MENNPQANPYNINQFYAPYDPYMGMDDPVEMPFRFGPEERHHFHHHMHHHVHHHVHHHIFHREFSPMRPY